MVPSSLDPLAEVLGDPHWVSCLSSDAVSPYPGPGCVSLWTHHR